MSEEQLKARIEVLESALRRVLAADDHARTGRKRPAHDPALRGGTASAAE